MEVNNGIFLPGGNALVYLDKSMNKKYSTRFLWGHPFRTYVSHDRFFNPLFPYIPVHILDDPPPFLNQKANKNIQTSYSLKYKHLKKKIIYEKITGNIG